MPPSAPPTTLRIRIVAPAILLALFAGLPALAAEDGVPAAPDWARRHIEAQVGVWQTDNSAHLGEQEPAEVYGIDYVASPSPAAMTGRLYGLAGGKEIGTYWEFRLFWHPGDEALIVQQFGMDGTVGVGRISEVGENRYRSEQTFYRLGAPAPTETAHDFTWNDPDTHTTTSYERVNGEWKEGRTYVWKRAGASDG